MHYSVFFYIEIVSFFESLEEHEVKQQSTDIQVAPDVYSKLLYYSQPKTTLVSAMTCGDS
jgi:hypothetical protein